MKQIPHETEVPLNSRASQLVSGASFYDAWQISSSRVDRSALEHFLAAAQKTPRWINAAMSTRNNIVRFFGLKNLGTLDGFDETREPKAYAPGDRVGIFTLFENTFDEVLLGDKDKHLNVVLSVHRKLLPGGQAVEVTLTTVVCQLLLLIASLHLRYLRELPINHRVRFLNRNFMLRDVALLRRFQIY
jgi:Protein of unknown function (DUF2867)